MSQNQRRNRRQNEASRRDERVDTMGTNVYSSKDDQSMHNGLNGQFILYHILIEHLLDETKDLPNAISTLYEYFQPEDKNDQETLREFDKEYQSSKAIHWYTRETCIYKSLNKALRTQNIDDVVAFAKLVRDLNKQLKEEQKKFAKVHKYPMITVFRGQFISKDELNRLKSSLGQLISMNSFLSTSTNRDKAIEFATSRAPPNDQLASILLEINVDIQNRSRPLADVKHLSAFSEEEEILFMFGAIFRIDDIRYDQETKLWRAQFTMCDDGDSDLQEFLSSVDNKLDGQNKLVALGTYLVQMQKYEDAEEHYEKILDNNLIDNSIDLAYCHHGLAHVNEKKMNYKSAIRNLDKAVEYLLKTSSNRDHPLISQCYNDLAKVYLEQKNFISSFHFYEKALRTKNNIPSISYSGLSQIHFKLENYTLSLEYLTKALERQSPTAHEFIANTYIDMGKVYSALNEKDKASEMFHKAIVYQSKILGKEHPDLSYTYNALGLMYSRMNDESKAFEFIEKAYQLQSQTLPNDHLDFTETFTNIGDLYMKRGDFDKALSYYNKTLETQFKTLLWNHPAVTKTYAVIARLHRAKKDYKHALVYFHKILDSELTRNKIDDVSLSTAYKDLADLYFEKDDLDQALDFYLQFLHNELETKLYPDISLAETYETIATIYSKKHLLNQSLVYYNRLLDCYLQIKPYDESAITRIYGGIGKVYLKKRRFDTSLLYYDAIRTKSEERSFHENQFEGIDNLHFERRHLDQVLNYFEKCFHQSSINSSTTHLSLEKICNILANICFEKKDYDKSLTYFLHLLDNKLRRKQINDYSLHNIYEAIGTIYLKKNNPSEALTYFNRLSDCQCERLKSFDHSSIRKTYYLIGKVYLAKHELDQTSNYLNKLIQTTAQNENKKKTNFEDLLFEKRHLDESLAYFQKLFYKEKKHDSKKLFSTEDTYTIIANIYLEKQENDKALKYFHQLLNYQLNRNSLGDISSSNTYTTIANLYMKLGYSNQALQYYRQALYICQRIKSTNRLIIQNLQCHIRGILLPNI